MQTVMLRMPAVDIQFLDALSLRMGWERVSQQPKESPITKEIASDKNGLDMALEDVKAGRVSQVFTSADDLCKHLGI